MSSIGQPERATQNRVIALFRDELGYRFLGDWADRTGEVAPFSWTVCGLGSYELASTVCMLAS